MSERRTIGVLVPLVSGAYFGAALRGIADQARAHGNRSVAIQTLDAVIGHEYAGVPDLTEHTAWEQVDGMILVTHAASPEFISAFHATGKPVVLISHDVPGLAVPKVTPDNRRGVRESVTHLIEHGHTRIAFAGHPEQADLDERYEAYLESMAEHGLDPSGLFYESGVSTMAGGQHAGRAMLAAGLPSTAVIAGNDFNAIGIMNTLQDAGVRISEDQAIIGFDDGALAEYQTPSLSTVNQHVEAVGALGVDLICRMLDGEPVEPGQHVVLSTLVRRRSCGCTVTAELADGEDLNAIKGASLKPDTLPDILTGLLLTTLPEQDSAPSEELVAAATAITRAVLAAARDPELAPPDDQGDAPPDMPTPVALFDAVMTFYGAHPRGEMASSVIAVLQSVVARLCSSATGPAAMRKRLDAIVRQVAVDFGAARAHSVMKTTRHVQQSLRAEYDISMSLLREHRDTPGSLTWLANSPVSSGCLGLWTGDGPGNRGLDVVSTFGDVEFELGEMPSESFPPEELIAAVDRHPGTHVAVLAVKTDQRDWGLLAVVGPPEVNTLTGHETYFEWAAMLGSALDHELMVKSLHHQREDLTLAFEREQALTESIRSSEQRYALAAAAANDGLWDWDLDTDTVYYSPRWKALVGHADDEIGTSPDEWLSRVHSEDLDELNRLIDRCRTGIAKDLEHEHRMRANDGTDRWVSCRALATPGEGRPATRLVGSLTDITERHALEEKLRHQALYDALTGLPNRPLFLDRLDRAIARQLRTGTGDFAVVFLDLDGFKLVNDSLGHAKGDLLLRLVAERIRACLRGTDTAARLGGDEFTVLLDDVTDLTAVPDIVRKLQDHIKAPYEIGGNTLVVSASAGITTSARPYAAADDVLRDADIAMYRAKSNEPGSAMVFDPSMHDSILRRLRAESRLRRAIETDALVLYYQPIVNLSTGQVTGAEALIRWPQRDGRIALPGEFLPIAEETGLIVPMGRTVAAQVCRQLAAWRSTGQLKEVFPISINVSHREFWNPDLVANLVRSLEANKLGPEWLIVEITEGVLMGNVEEGRRRLAELHDMGIRLHVDDFGTGYSSLEALHRFPIDALKIDRGFVARLENDVRSREIVGTIVTLTHGLNIEGIAEGIETTEQRRLLIELGCPSGQGYLFARPMPAADMAAFLPMAADPTMAGG